MDLVGQVPVVKLYPEVSVGGNLPVSIVVRVTSLRPKLDPNAAIPVWGVLRDSLGPQRRPAGIILDLPVVKEGFDGFVANLAKVSRVPVIPLLTSDQLAVPQVRAVVRAAGTCSILAYGAIGLERRGARPSDHALRDQLAPLRGTGVRPRIAFVLRPEIRPPLRRWGEDLDPLTDPGVADISVHSELDRSFVFRRALTWSGHRWEPGQTVALRWMDVARLDAGLHEASTVLLPEVIGWDLVTLPPPGDALGISREALLRYLRGEGPGFEPQVRVERRGRTLRVTLSNPSPFASAVSTYGSWVEVSLNGGALVANDRGGFDRIVIGNVREGGEWRRLVGAGMANAVRFYETYVAPEESLTTGIVRLPSRQSHATVRWTILLSTGQELSGRAP
ncbi:MAG TPA: hypothetical protein ENK19_10320 [Acidobacteria bacterium]|nr:hypothetical protein [Acidobacteriota bacterium]